MKKKSRYGKKDRHSPQAIKGMEKFVQEEKTETRKYRKAKRSASAPSGSKNPFGKLSTDKIAGAGRRIQTGILSQKSGQHKLDTGSTLLKKAMRKMARSHGR